MGNEISEQTLLATNAAHPDLDRYEGRMVRTGGGLNASEVFLAEMADYLKQYEQDLYGVTHLVSYANQIRTACLKSDRGQRAPPPPEHWPSLVH